MNNELYLINDIEIDVFDKLYDNTIDEVELQRIKQKIELDKVLQNKYLIYSKLRNEIEYEGLTQLEMKQRLKSLDLRQKLKKRKLFLGAAFVTAFVITAIIVFTNFNQNTEVDLYEKFKDSEIGLSITMSETDKNPISIAMINIAKEDFNTAITELKKCKKSDTTSYYLAYCYERIGKEKVALKLYNHLLESVSGDFRDKCLFRIALLHLKCNNLEATDELKEIASDPENLYKNLSEEILKLMEKG